MPKITIIAKITKIINQGSDNGKYNKSLKESRERPFTNVLKISTVARLTKIANQVSDTGKYNKSLISERKQGKSLTNVTKTPRITN